jgi:tetratricopeptide (TPR) repeat protein
VSTVPGEIAGVGATSQRLRVSPGFDPLKAAVGPEEYFVLSRIDGKQTLRDVLLATGLPVERAIAIVTRLRSIGALLLPGEAAPAAIPAAPRAPTTQGVTSRPMPSMARAPVGTPMSPVAPRSSTPAVRSEQSTELVDGELSHDLHLAHATDAELAALAESNDLTDTERRRILAIARLIDKNDPYAILGLHAGADAKTLKRTYFLLSKEIHPDRYYGKKLGSFADKMNAVFEATSRAYARLTTHDKTQASHPGTRSPPQDQPQTPQAYAAELFDRACQLEVGGNALDAMKLFAAAVRMDPQMRYLRRATSCALAAGQPRSAVEYAKKANTLAPNDPSSARLLAAAFRAAGKLSDAEEVLVMAMALKSENDALGAELRNDLAELRRLLANP